MRRRNSLKLRDQQLSIGSVYFKRYTDQEKGLE